MKGNLANEQLAKVICRNVTLWKSDHWNTQNAERVSSLPVLQAKFQERLFLRSLQTFIVL